VDGLDRGLDLEAARPSESVCAMEVLLAERDELRVPERGVLLVDRHELVARSARGAAREGKRDERGEAQRLGLVG
jgi:hypothetical protein